ncbi:hypothetical protein BD311DRAFT_230841 [Dichomitus squalens]|uniref:Uncharacterized protein n=1 Tax=Dichomitus squalens TaxID=114155 RepID=A0A4Q9MUT6_9APHY|nr:hypothetical protein BD311DRAFT_230841 [Dichomitus squalens]
MPHPSSLVDDTSAPSYNREHGRPTVVSRTFGSWLLRAACNRGTASQRGERMSDRLLSSHLFVLFLCSGLKCEILLHQTSHWTM